MIYHAEKREVVTIAGLGTWPRALDPDFFMREHGGKIPLGVLRIVVPAAPDAWITALKRYGTMSFGEVAAASIRLARDGFPMYPLMAASIEKQQERLRQWPSSAAVMLPNDRPPQVGEVFRQSDLAASLQYMADEEKAASGAGATPDSTRRATPFIGATSRGRSSALSRSKAGCCRPRTWRITIRRSLRPSGGASAISKYSPAARGARGRRCCKRWRCSKAPISAALGHNSADYIHTLTEALKLAFADREAYYTDPAVGNVPLADADLVGIRGRTAQTDPARQGVAGNAAAGPARRDGSATARQPAEPEPGARHLLCLRRRPLGQSVFGDAERRLATARRWSPAPA